MAEVRKWYLTIQGKMAIITGFFSFFRAVPAACESSQARSQIGAAVAADLHHNSRQRRIFNPLSKVRDVAWILHCCGSGVVQWL